MIYKRLIKERAFKFEPFVYTILSIKYVQTKPYM